MRQLGVASSENDVARILGIQFFFHRFANVDLGKNAESFLLEFLFYLLNSAVVPKRHDLAESISLTCDGLGRHRLLPLKWHYAVLKTNFPQPTIIVLLACRVHIAARGFLRALLYVATSN